MSFTLTNAEAARARVLLLDIEGTTTPIDFVYKTLFPYASRRVEPFLREHMGDPDIAALLHDLHGQRNADDGAGHQPPAWRDDGGGEATILSAVEYLRWLMAGDSKCTALKALQGKIWQQGFDNGELHGEVYEDVPPAFARWRAQGREIFIYSSGSVQAQQMLFRTIATGDMTPSISGFFDTQVGPKVSADSYRKIAASLGRQPQQILFISDATKEVEAARAAGMMALLCDRLASDSCRGTVIRSFDNVLRG